MTAGVSPEMLNKQADEVAEHLTRGEKTWAATSLAQRTGLLDRFQHLTADSAAEWTQVATRIKSRPVESPLVGEEWISGPWAVLTYVNALADTLRRLQRGQNPLDGLRTTGRRLTSFAARPRLTALPTIFASALRG